MTEAHRSSGQSGVEQRPGASSPTMTDSVRGPLSDVTLMSTPTPSVEPAPGWRLGGTDGARFELMERLGGGGMAVVFLARDTVLDRKVAIKFLTHKVLGTDDGLERLQLEARACARLSHENIVRLFDMGTDQGLPFLVMEHLEGRPLDAIVRDGSIDARRVVNILIEVARGLSQAHRAGILHRDLKPSNVFIAKDGTAKILDFGVATMAHGPRAMHGGLWGTPRYMSPEQWKGEVQDGRTDIWAAGVMFFELLTGTAPFDGGNIAEIRDVVVSPSPAPSLRTLRPELPEEAEHIAQRAMKKNAAERFGTADELLDALVALEVALAHGMRIRNEEPEGRARHKPEMRQVTVLSCTLDELPEHPGESGLDELAASLDDFFEVCATVIRQLEGTVLSLLGPRLLACFGYPIAHEDNAPRALRAASLIVDAMNGQRAVRIGIGTSLSVVSRTESTTAPVTLQGDALHLAQWLERRAGPNEIVIGQLTEALVRSTFELEPRGEAVPEGSARPVRSYRVIRSKTARFERVVGTVLTPLVGREHELDELRELVERARAGKGQFVLISGEAGIGKSRLVAQHLEQTATESPAIVRCQCWPHFQNSALEPILEGLTRKVGVRRDAPASEKIAVLESTLAEIALPASEHVPPIARFLGIPTGDRYPPLLVSPDLLRKRVQHTLVSLLLHAAARQPLTLIVEDAHWSDTSTLDLLDRLMGAMVQSRLMVIVTTRPAFDPPWPRSSQLHRIALGRLSSGQTGAMIAFASQGRRLPPPLIEQLAARADGVPLFVEELTRSVADAYQEAEQRGGVVPLDAFASSALPATLEGLLRARLGALPHEGQDVARVAAVLGRDATYEMIRRTSELGEKPLRIGLMQLVEAGILHQESQGPALVYVFRHALLREAAYQSLIKNERRDVHRRAAHVLVEHFPEVAEQNPEVVATHFVEGGLHERAIPYFEKAGARAALRLANADAATHYGRAIAQLQKLPHDEARDRRELALQLARGTVLIAANWTDSPEARQTYARVRELESITRAGDARPFPSLLGLNRFYASAGQTKASAALGRELVALAEEADDDEMRILAYASFGPDLLLLGHTLEAHDLLAKGLGLHDVRKHGKLAMRLGFDPGVFLSMYFAQALCFLGSPDSALERARCAVAIARAVNHPLSLGVSLAFLGAWHGHRGEYDDLARVSEEARVVAEEYGLTLALAMSKLGKGWARVGQGDREGIRELEEAVTEYRKGSVRTGFTYFLVVLAWVQWNIGALEDAGSTLDDMASFIDATGECQFEPELFRLRGDILLQSGGDPAGAEVYFQRGLDIARRQHTRAWELRLAYSYARLLASRSQQKEARAMLAPIVALYTEGLDTLDVRQARGLLAELG